MSYDESDRLSKDSSLLSTSETKLLGLCNLVIIIIILHYAEKISTKITTVIQ